MTIMLPKFGSEAFRKGFVEGITPVHGIFRRTEFRRAKDVDASVEAAWIAVGEALKSATESQGKRVVKTTRGKKPAGAGRRKR